MKTIEFQGTVTPNSQITIPAELAVQVPSGESIHVVLQWEVSPEADDSWRAHGRRQFEAAYAPRRFNLRTVDRMKLGLGEVILVRMEFGDEDVVAAPVTSQPRLSEFDLAIQDWAEAGLNVPSCMRLHKLTVLPKFGNARSIGMLTDSNRNALLQLLHRAFQG